MTKSVCSYFIQTIFEFFKSLEFRIQCFEMVWLRLILSHGNFFLPFLPFCEDSYMLYLPKRNEEIQGLQNRT